MRKIPARVLAFVLLFSSFTAVARAEGEAQSARQLATVEQRAEFRTERMKDALELEGEQLEKVRAINLKYAKEAEQITQAGDSEEDRFTKLAAMAAKKDDELRAVLTPEQFQTYESKRKDWQARAAASGKPAGTD